MKTRCFKCRGKGTLVSADAKFAAAITFGLLLPLLLVEKDDCDACGGKGYINA